MPEAEWPRAIEELCAYPHIEEAAVLSTCNRMELYVVAASWHRGVREVEDWLSRSSGVPLEELRPYLFLLRDRDATHHLLRVAGGLDSLVMGEGQILAQVRAWAWAWPRCLPALTCSADLLLVSLFWSCLLIVPVIAMHACKHHIQPPCVH